MPQRFSLCKRINYTRQKWRRPRLSRRRMDNQPDVSCLSVDIHVPHLELSIYLSLLFSTVFLVDSLLFVIVLFIHGYLNHIYRYLYQVQNSIFLCSRRSLLWKTGGNVEGQI